MKQRKAMSTRRKKQRKREAPKPKSFIKQFCRPKTLAEWQTVKARNGDWVEKNLPPSER